MAKVKERLPPNCHIQIYLTEIAQEFELKGVWYLDLWPFAPLQVILTDAHLMDHVQVSNPMDKHTAVRDLVEPILGSQSIVAVNGALWKSSHKAMLAAMSISNTRRFTKMMSEKVLTYRDTMERYAAKDTHFSMWAETTKAIFDISAQFVFGFPTTAQTDGSQHLDDIHKLIRNTVAAVGPNPITKATSFIKNIPTRRRLDSSLRDKVRDRLSVLRAERSAITQKEGCSVLDALLHAAMPLHHDHIKSNEAEGGVSAEMIELIITNLKTTMIGGLNSSVNTICWLTMIASKHPEVLRQIREEHDAVFHKSFEDTITMLQNEPQRLSQLNYTTAVIKETLRLFPPGFAIHEAPKSATIHYQGQEYPIGDMMIVAAWHTMQYDAVHYSEPDSFRPERFLADDVPPNHFRTFSKGPRKCIGEAFAMEMIKAFLVLTVRDFEYELVGTEPNPEPKSRYTDWDTIYGDTVFPVFAIEAQPRGGIKMKVKKVNRT